MTGASYEGSGSMKISLDWWAVLIATALVVLVWAKVLPLITW